MENSAIVPFLFFATLALGLVYGVIQYFKAKKARREHHHSATERQDMREASAERPQAEPVRR